MDQIITDSQTKETLRLHENKIAIVGPPNVGKSVLFNKFALSYSVVSNFAQTTIEEVRKAIHLFGRRIEVIDTPGITSVQAHSEDERATVDILINEHPEAILFCVNTARLKQGLAVLSQVIEFSYPTVLCLNMIDEAVQKGVVVDTKKLSEITGLPVTETAAIHGSGLAEVKESLTRAAIGTSRVRYPKPLENALEELLKLFPEKHAPQKGVLTLFLAADKSAERMINDRFGGETADKADRIAKDLYTIIPVVSLRYAVLKAHEAWADKVAEKVITSQGGGASWLSMQMARYSRHPIFGWPILLMVMYITFKGVATLAPPIAQELENWIFLPIALLIEKASPNQFMAEFLVGPFGIFTMGVMNSIVTVGPILIVFFLILNTLEDIGYLPNVSVLANRTLSKAGLSGKASLMLVLGFGCNTMATLTTRMLETKKERIIVSSLIALGVPCAVQLGVMIAILAAAPFSALLMVVGAVILTQIMAGLLLNRLVPAVNPVEFIMELPQFRLPVVSFTIKKTWYRVKWFLMEAVPLFIFGAALMFFLEKTGFLEVINKFFAPVITGFLSLPEKTTEVFLLVLSRRELGAVYFQDMVEAGGVDYYQLVTGLVVMTLFIPCISNTMVMIKELGLRWAVAINAGIMVAAVLVGGVVNVFVRLF